MRALEEDKAALEAERAELQARLAAVSTDVHRSEEMAAESVAELRRQLALYEEQLQEAASRSQQLNAQLQAADLAREAAEQVGGSVGPVHTRGGGMSGPAH